MEANFPMATSEELEKNSDDCAICWDHMDSARKLPCGHLFHNSCLRSWLEQDTSCPTCRTSLKNRNEDEEESHDSPGMIGERDVRDNTNRGVGNPGRTNHFFHFDGSRYASWLPSVSVEVTRPIVVGVNVGTDANNTNGMSRALLQNSQLENMARQVFEWFPHIPLSTINDDLRITRSVEITIENILDGRVSAPTQSTSSSRYFEKFLFSQYFIIMNFIMMTIFVFRSLPEHESSSSSLNTNIMVSPTTSTSTPAQQIDWDQVTDEEDELNASQTKTSFNGGRFSKSSQERERILNKRKDDLLKAARKNYLSKQRRPALNSTNSQSSNFFDDFN